MTARATSKATAAALCAPVATASVPREAIARAAQSFGLEGPHVEGSLVGHVQRMARDHPGQSAPTRCGMAQDIPGPIHGRPDGDRTAMIAIRTDAAGKAAGQRNVLQRLPVESTRGDGMF